VTRYLNRLQPLGLLVMRVVLGVIMVAHAWQKVTGGRNLTATVSSWGWPWWLGYVSTYTELIGGALLVVGLLTRVWGLGLTINMVVAIWKVHWKNGLIGQGSIEFPLALAAIAFALIWLGAGPLSIDYLFFGEPGGARPAKAAKK